MTITSVTFIGPVATPHRNSSADHAGGRQVGCVSLLGFASFCLTNFFVKNVFINGGVRLIGKVEACSLGWSLRVWLPLLAAHFTATSQLINYTFALHDCYVRRWLLRLADRKVPS